MKQHKTNWYRQQAYILNFIGAKLYLYISTVLRKIYIALTLKCKILSFYLSLSPKQRFVKN